MRADPRVVIAATDFDAGLFDMDGVITQTAAVHAAAWKQLFDAYSEERVRRGLQGYAPFDIDVDYRRYVDGRPRYDGVAAFLASRGIVLPRGSPDDDPAVETVCGLGNRKDAYFWERVRRDGVQTYPTTVALIHDLKSAGVRAGVFSASRNAEAILSAAGVVSMFDARVDGVDAERLRLPGKPDPAMLIELARRLRAAPSRAAVFEDAIAGVQAGRAGGFRLVVGVNRSSDAGSLLANGADVEVRDLGEVAVRAAPP